MPLQADRAHGAQPQSRQLLRRDRAGRVLHRAHRAGHRLQQRSAARRAASIRTSTRRSSRLGGPNFHEIPINAPVAQVHNNQRDGMHRQAIHRGRVAYEPNSLGGGCPFQAGMKGFMSFPQPMEERQGARQAREVCRPLHAGDALLRKPDRRREGAHRRGVPLRADQGAGARGARARRRDACATSPRSWPQAVADGLGMRAAASRCRKCCERAPKPEVETSPRAVAASRAPATAASARADRDPRGRRRRRRSADARCTKR